GLNALLKRQFFTAEKRLTEAINYLKPLNVPYQILLVEYHLLIVYFAQEEKEKGLQSLSQVKSKVKKMGLGPMSTKLDQTLPQSALLPETQPNPLTRRQTEVLKLLSDGLSNKEIAGKLFLSPRTIDMHIRVIFEKLYWRTRTEAVKIGAEKGLIPLVSFQ